MINFDFAKIPPISQKRIAIRVESYAERTLRSGHPWVFEDAIKQQSQSGRAGDLAVIFDRKNRFLAAGIFDPDSVIRVRVLQFNEPAIIDQNWFRRKIDAAVSLRRPLVDKDTNAYRLVHGENDGLPGLVIDKYADYGVIKIYTPAWLPHLQAIVNILEEKGFHGVVCRLGDNLKKSIPENIGLADGQIIAGKSPAGPVPFVENGMHFQADIIQGQKTGFFLDQRDNRSIVEGMAKDKSVLNVFSYTGGFSLYAARGGASYVASLDLSRPALLMAESHFKLNEKFPGVREAKHEIIRGDAYQVLGDLHNQNHRFDLIILDPPAFARSKDSIERAKRAYFRLNSLGISLLKPGGILVSASCSSRVSTDDFFEIVQKAAFKEGRKLTVIQKTGQPIDHPVGFPEGEYLKCLFAKVI